MSLSRAGTQMILRVSDSQKVLTHFEFWASPKIQCTLSGIPQPNKRYSNFWKLNLLNFLTNYRTFDKMWQFLEMCTYILLFSYIFPPTTSSMKILPFSISKIILVFMYLCILNNFQTRRTRYARKTDKTTKKQHWNICSFV